MPLDPATICVLANPGSGLNSRDAAAIDRAMAVFGPAATLRRWQPDEPLADAVAQALADGFTTIVAAGGDGTVRGVAEALMGREAALGVLPLGTFNFFARGLGLGPDPAEAARALLAGRVHRISVGTVNGRLFLNNASLGLYPLILQTRERAYRRFGRSRLMAYWTVISTLAGARATRRMVIHADGQSHDLRSPLLFVARSAYQLRHYNLGGAEAISADRFVVFLLRDGSRWQMLKAVAKLALGRVEVGREIASFQTAAMEVTPASRRPLVAMDGERERIRAPLRFVIHADALAVIVPRPEDRAGA